MKYNNYLFDLDGTLIDTTEMIWQCFQNTLTVFGIDGFTRELIVSKIGMPLKDQVEDLIGTVSDEKYAEILAVHMGHQNKIYKEYLGLFDGVVDVLATLKANGKKLAIVTSRKRESAERFSREMGIFEYFDAFITPESTKKHKPDKEPVMEAIKQLGGDMNSIFVGDAVYDIASGKAAGVDTAFVSWSHTASSDLSVEPSYVLENFTDLLEK
jgi:pyrophosphatase PpaX